jgi:hypothetical protein
MLDQLKRHKDKGRGDLEIIAVHGGSGTYEPTGGVYISEVEEGDEELLGLAEGAQFIVLYTGN